jgi:hypothetical protein
MQFQHTQPIFDYRALRLAMGIIALSLTVVVTFIAVESLASVSASYYSNARDVFVGLLFVVSAFLFAYNGHSTTQSVASKFAALAAVCVAVFPTSKSCEESSWVSTVHLTAAVVLFAILIYFCLGPFREKTKGMGGKKGRRAHLYRGCALVMIGAMLTGAVGTFALTCEVRTEIRLIYWVEAIALAAFGVAWIVAGKLLPPLVDEEEALKLFRR